MSKIVGRAGGIVGIAGLTVYVLTGHGSWWGWDRLGGAAVFLGLGIALGYGIRLLRRRKS